MAVNVYALIRVSTDKQSEKRQVIRMLQLGVPKENIIIEKESGKSTVRTKYHRLVKKLKAGDILHIENIDRLGRDYDSIIREWNKLTLEKSVIIKVLDTPMLDTDQTNDDLTSKYMRNILLHTEAYQSENEWRKTKCRQAQGIAVAKTEGKNLGRPKKIRTKKEIETAKQYLNDEINLNTALDISGLKKSAFYNLCQAVKDERIKII